MIILKEVTNNIGKKEQQMNNPKINILIRTMDGRESQLAKCLNSITSQTYKNIEVKVHHDNSKVNEGYHYNLFCNTLKEQVNDGFYFFLDDDDNIHNENSLAEIAVELTDPNQAVICQFLRSGTKRKPSDEMMDRKEIINGKIGMPCIILHHTQKNIAQFTNTENADYLFIKEISEKLPCKFVKKILVNSPKRSFGK